MSIQSIFAELQANREHQFNPEVQPDRETHSFELHPMTIDEASFYKHTDRLSLLMSQKHLMLAMLLMSDFEFSPPEIGRRVLYLRENEGADENQKEDSLRNRNSMNNGMFREASKLVMPLLTRYIGKYTDVKGNWMLKNPVYSISDNEAFLDLLVASTLSMEYSDLFAFPKRTEEGQYNNFTLQIMILNTLVKATAGEKGTPSSKMYEIASQYKHDNTTVYRLLVKPLLEAKFVEVKGYEYELHLDEIKTDHQQTVLRDFLLEMFPANVDVIKISHSDLRKRLTTAFQNKNPENLSEAAISKKISSFIWYLTSEQRINKIEKWYNPIYQETIGTHEESVEYKSTKEGEDFLKRLTLMYTDPREVFGEASEYSVCGSDRLLEYSELSDKLKVLLQYFLRVCGYLS